MMRTKLSSLYLAVGLALAAGPSFAVSADSTAAVPDDPCANTTQCYKVLAQIVDVVSNLQSGGRPEVIVHFVAFDAIAKQVVAPAGYTERIFTSGPNLGEGLGFVTYQPITVDDLGNDEAIKKRVASGLSNIMRINGRRRNAVVKVYFLHDPIPVQ